MLTALGFSAGSSNIYDEALSTLLSDFRRYTSAKQVILEQDKVDRLGAALAESGCDVVLSTYWQGLTLVHISAESKHFL